MATLSPVTLGIIIFLGFLPLLLLRPLIENRFVLQANPVYQAKRAFFLDFSICCMASVLANGINYVVYSFPVSSMGSLLIGCVIAGFFIGLESSLTQERKVILEAMEKNEETVLPRHFFPMTRKFTFIAITTSVFVSLVLILVFTRDVEWLAKTAQDPKSIANAQLSVIYEIFFIMSILMILIVNLIFSYSKNLKLLFNNETHILEKVSKGDLSNKVPIATHDEFGVIASHTNQMIDGLRHRFELISSLKLAEEVQQNLLPSQSPYLEHYDISGSSNYCDQTGGDYYDYFLLPDNKMGIVVADACGHGIGAAMLMTSVRAFLISAIEHYSSPEELLTQINTHITKDCSVSGRFTTMFFMEIDQTKKQLRWIRAGHEPALYYHAKTDTFSILMGEGLVLGVDETFNFKANKTIAHESGDIILIGTDGISETRNSENKFFGHSRIEEIIKTNNDSSAHAIQQSLVDSVQTFRGDHAQEDDITLVVVKIR